MTMIFRHGFFHGDPHPANILVLGDGEHIGLVDFGQVGKLSEEDMSKLTRLFIDAATERVDALPRRLAELGVRYPKEREEEFVAELRELFYRYYGASLAEIDPLQVIREAFALIYSLNLRLPTRFVLLDKAIATLASVTVELYPDFNVFEVAKPYARELMLERYTPRRVLTRARKEGIELARVVRDMPYQVHDVLEELRDGQIEVGFVHKGLDHGPDRAGLQPARHRPVVSGGLIGSSLLGIFATGGPEILGINSLSVIGFLVSGSRAPGSLGVPRSGRRAAVSAVPLDSRRAAPRERHAAERPCPRPPATPRAWPPARRSRRILRGRLPAERAQTSLPVGRQRRRQQRASAEPKRGAGLPSTTGGGTGRGGTSTGALEHGCRGLISSRLGLLALGAVPARLRRSGDRARPARLGRGRSRARVRRRVRRLSRAAVPLRGAAGADPGGAPTCHPARARLDGGRRAPDRAAPGRVLVAGVRAGRPRRRGSTTFA